MRKLQRFQGKIDEYTIDIYIEEDNKENLQTLNEAQQRGRYCLKGPYSVDEHPAFNSVSQHHLHVYWRNKELFSINIDGSAHDGSHDYTIPNKIREPLKNIFSNYNFPSSWIIESVDQATLEQPPMINLLKKILEYINPHGKKV